MKKIKRKKRKQAAGLQGIQMHKGTKMSADEHFSRGMAHHKRGELDQAIAYYRKALEMSQASAPVLYQLGTAYHAKHRTDEALHYYKKAVVLSPDLIEANYNMGTIFQALKRLDEAIACYQKVIQLKPGLSDPHYNLGLAYQEQGRQQEAVEAFDEALRHNPGFFTARWARCMAQIPVISQDDSRIEVSRARYREELLNLQKTLPPDTPQAVHAAAEAVGKQQPFFLAYQGMNDRELQALYGDIVCRIMSAKYPQFCKRPPMPPHMPGEPLRVGIVSAFFYYHAVWKIPIRGWIENLDRNRIHLYGYYTGMKKDRETEAARTCFRRFVNEAQSFERLCEIIRSDNLHVLIYPEIGMDPMTAKLASLRLAPVQCTSWGHPETSGLPTIDYFLSSDMIEPKGADEHYTEKLVRLPNLSVHYTPLETAHAVLSRTTLGLRPDSILYHCCQSLYKFLPQHDGIFPRIAREAGDCQFLFSSYPNIGPVIGKFRSRMDRAFREYEMNADDHVAFLPPLAPDHYQALNRLADVYLDTIGWSGCNSVLEALASALPVVTMPTGLMRGREATAILTMMDIPDLLAETPDEYVELAVKLGTDRDRRRFVSEEIAKRKQAAYRDKKCISGLEDALARIVREQADSSDISVRTDEGDSD